MEREQVKNIIESMLYMTDHALTSKEIIEILDTKEWKPEEISAIIQDIANDYKSRDSALQVIEVAGGVQIATRPEMGAYIRKLYKERLTVRLSPSALETLSIIAYKQPIARSEIEQIRGVEATGVMETLLERRLVKAVGRKETIGRPMLYGTTIEFLRQFGLKHLSELPDLDSFTPKDEIKADAGAPAEASAETAAEPAQEELVLSEVAVETIAENGSEPVAAEPSLETPPDQCPN